MYLSCFVPMCFVRISDLQRETCGSVSRGLKCRRCSGCFKMFTCRRLLLRLKSFRPSRRSACTARDLKGVEQYGSLSVYVSSSSPFVHAKNEELAWPRNRQFCRFYLMSSGTKHCYCFAAASRIYPSWIFPVSLICCIVNFACCFRLSCSFFQLFFVLSSSWVVVL